MHQEQKNCQIDQLPDVNEDDIPKVLLVKAHHRFLMALSQKLVSSDVQVVVLKVSFQNPGVAGEEQKYHEKRYQLGQVVSYGNGEFDLKHDVVASGH